MTHTEAQSQQEPVAWRNAAIRLGEELSSVGPVGYYDMTAAQWLDWAMAQEPRGKNSLAQPNYRAVKTYHEGEPVYVAQQEQNLNCKSTQARLATAWGYVKAQPEQEPVAWMHNFIDGGITFGKRPADLERHPDRWTALFKDPKPCPTCEALARTVMLDQTSHDAAPPQRTWVGLNEDEIDYLIDLAYTGDEEFVKTIEAKLKEKNLPCIKPKWIGLTEKEHTDIAVECGCMSADWVFYGAAVERKLKERNT